MFYFDFLSEDAKDLIEKQIAYAFSYMHGENICHRDLKLEIILMMNNSPTSRVKTTDFRLSKHRAWD